MSFYKERIKGLRFYIGDKLFEVRTYNSKRDIYRCYILRTDENKAINFRLLSLEDVLVHLRTTQLLRVLNGW